MKRKLLSLALVLAMALTLLPTAAFAAGMAATETDAYPSKDVFLDGSSVPNDPTAAKLCDQSKLINDGAANIGLATMSAQTVPDGGGSKVDPSTTADVSFTLTQATGIPEHWNGNNPKDKGWWVSAVINGPASQGAAGLKTAFADSLAEVKEASALKGNARPDATGNNPYCNFYFNVDPDEIAYGAKRFLRVVWYSQGVNDDGQNDKRTPDNAISDTIYEITFNGKTLKTVVLTADPIYTGGESYTTVLHAPEGVTFKDTIATPGNVFKVNTTALTDDEVKAKLSAPATPNTTSLATVSNAVTAPDGKSVTLTLTGGTAEKGQKLRLSVAVSAAAFQTADIGRVELVEVTVADPTPAELTVTPTFHVGDTGTLTANVELDGATFKATSALTDGAQDITAVSAANEGLEVTGLTATAGQATGTLTLSSATALAAGTVTFTIPKALLTADTGRIVDADGLVATNVAIPAAVTSTATLSGITVGGTTVTPTGYTDSDSHTWVAGDAVEKSFVYDDAENIVIKATASPSTSKLYYATSSDLTLPMEWTSTEGGTFTLHHADLTVGGSKYVWLKAGNGTGEVFPTYYLLKITVGNDVTVTVTPPTQAEPELAPALQETLTDTQLAQAEEAIAATQVANSTSANNLAQAAKIYAAMNYTEAQAKAVLRDAAVGQEVTIDVSVEIRESGSTYNKDTGVYTIDITPYITIDAVAGSTRINMGKTRLTETFGEDIWWTIGVPDYISKPGQNVRVVNSDAIDAGVKGRWVKPVESNKTASIDIHHFSAFTMAWTNEAADANVPSGGNGSTSSTPSGSTSSTGSGSGVNRGSGSGASKNTGGGASGPVSNGGGTIDVTPSTVGGFSDVPTSNTFATYIAWAQENGIMGGYSDGTFRPNANTTRQALWMVLARLAGANPANMAEARAWAINAGISDGTNDGKLNPEGPATRAHFAAFLYRYANLPSTSNTDEA